MTVRVLIDNVADDVELGEIIRKIEDEFCAYVEILDTYEDEDNEEDEEEECEGKTILDAAYEQYIHDKNMPDEEE